MFGSKKTTIPATGFYTQPKEYQNLYRSILGDMGFLGDAGQMQDMFRPLGITSYEQKALDQVGKGLAPTQESLQADIAMQMNPYNEYVIDDLNRQSQGQNSILNQAASRAGQMGSNRSFLGASDIESQRLGQIGQFRQDQYNTSLNNALGPIAGLRQQDISNQFGAGSFLRGLDLQQKQVPLTAAQASLGTFNTIPTSFGDFGAPERTVKTGGGLGGALGAIGSIAGGAFGGPLGATIGGAIGGGLGSGSLTGALQGGLSGYTGGFGGGGSFLGSGFNSVGQQFGSFFSPSPVGPYRPY